MGNLRLVLGVVIVDLLLEMHMISGNFSVIMVYYRYSMVLLIMLESQVSNKGIDSVLQFDLVEVLNDVETTKTINSILFSLCLFKVSMKLTDCRPMAPSP